MQISDLVIAGDTPGLSWQCPVFHFKGMSPDAPSVYIQAALHAGELPGTALAHFLCHHLRQAETEGRLLGNVTVVPQANPIGASQWHFGDMQGRFDLGSRVNFNRDFPLIHLDQRDGLLEGLDRLSATDRLKRQLLHMALGADLMLDLHCDDESLQYAYIDAVFWPEAADLASALSMDAVLLSDGESSAFEEAVAYAWKHPTSGEKAASLPGRLSTTVELRGTREVYPDMARQDAAGLLRFLVARGVVEADAAPLPLFSGPAAPLDNIAMIRAPEAGTVLFHRDIGETVVAGDTLAMIITRPGMDDGTIEVKAPRDGLIVTRVSQRFVRAAGDLMKIACNEAVSTTRKPGTLED